MNKENITKPESQETEKSPQPEANEVVDGLVEQANSDYTDVISTSNEIVSSPGATPTEKKQAQKLAKDAGGALGWFRKKAGGITKMISLLVTLSGPVEAIAKQIPDEDPKDKKIASYQARIPSDFQFQEFLKENSFQIIEQENIGQAEMVLPLELTHVDQNSLGDITEKDWEDPLDPTLPDEAENIPAEDVAKVLGEFQEKIDELYQSGGEASCVVISHVFHNLLREHGINSYVVESIVIYKPEAEVDYTNPDDLLNHHTYVVVKINDQEFRFDFTANQMFSEEVGLTVTPRTKGLTDNGPMYIQEGLESTEDYQMYMDLIKQALPGCVNQEG